jgi:hypothetical protein
MQSEVDLEARKAKPDFDVLRAEILDYHQNMIAAHWKKDVDFLVEDLAEDFVAVRNGEIEERTVEDLRLVFEDYLKNTEFREYRNLCDPLIGFSKDGSLAWSIVQVKIAGERTVPDGSTRELDFTCAWMTLFERRDKKWVRISEVSTFK